MKKNVVANPEFANSSRGQKLMERIKYEQGYVKPMSNVPTTIQKPTPTVKPIPKPKIGTAGKLLGSAAIIGTGILAANALTNKK